MEHLTQIPSDALAQLRDAVGEQAVSTDAAQIRELSKDSSVRSKKAEAADRPLAAAQVVVTPRSTEQVSAVLSWASTHGVPVVARGLGSGVVGSGLPVRGGVLLDLAELTEVGEVDVVST